MKAVIANKYGDVNVLSISNVPEPSINDDEILVKVNSTTVTTADARLRALNVPTGFQFLMRLALGFNKLKNPILGSEFSGAVVKIGKNVTEFKINELVFGFTGIAASSHAEYLKIKSDKAVAKIPTGTTLQDAASIPFGGTSSLYFLRDLGKIKSGDKVLINGASGNLGTFAVQLAKYFGAKVTAVTSKKNIQLVKSLGADKVIDYHTEELDSHGNDYDLVFDTIGVLKYRNVAKLLRKKGVYLQAVAGIPAYLNMALVNIFNSRKYKSGSAPEKKSDLIFLIKLMNENHLKSVIDKVYPLAEIKQAHLHVDSGHKVGSVVITI